MRWNSNAECIHINVEMRLIDIEQKVIEKNNGQDQTNQTTSAIKLSLNGVSPLTSADFLLHELHTYIYLHTNATSQGSAIPSRKMPSHQIATFYFCISIL